MPPSLVNTVHDEAALRRTLTEFSSQLTTIYLESETRIVLAPLSDFIGPKIMLPPVRWLTGRAFGPTLEIRWHMDSDNFATTALSETGIGPQGWQLSTWNTILDAEPHSRTVLLRGINVSALPPDHVLHNTQGGHWVDGRIPRLLNYPGVPVGAARVVLNCVDYLSQGLVVITRLCSLGVYEASTKS